MKSYKTVISLALCLTLLLMVFPLTAFGGVLDWDWAQEQCDQYGDNGIVAFGSIGIMGDNRPDGSNIHLWVASRPEEWNIANTSSGTTTLEKSFDVIPEAVFPAQFRLEYIFETTTQLTLVVGNKAPVTLKSTDPTYDRDKYTFTMNSPNDVITLTAKKSGKDTTIFKMTADYAGASTGTPNNNDNDSSTSNQENTGNSITSGTTSSDRSVSGGSGGGPSNAGWSWGDTVTSINSTRRSSNVKEDGSVNESAILSELKKVTSSGTSNIVSLKTKNAETISISTLKSISDTASKSKKSVILHADTMSQDGNVVQGRLYIEPNKFITLKSDLKLAVYTDTEHTKAIKSSFQKWYSNKACVVNWQQQGSLNTRVHIAVKVDLSGLNQKSLMFYYYDKANNTYNKIIDPSYYIDTKGFLHFYTENGGSIIITDKALVKK